MRLFLICMACQIEFGKPEFISYPADLLDNGTAEFECRHGHRSVHVLQSQKFEILADLAVTAICDGYYREAISTFSSALERFRQFYIAAVCRDRNLNEKKYDDLWKRVSKQSERQYGAYQFVYGLEEGELPADLSNDKVKLRNKIIHQGHIPTREDAISYGQAIADVINPALKMLISSKSKLLWEIEMENVSSVYRDSAGDKTMSTMNMRTMLDWSYLTSNQPPTVEDWLVHIEFMRNAISDMGNK